MFGRGASREDMHGSWPTTVILSTFFHQQFLAQPEARVSIDPASQTIAIKNAPRVQIPVDEFSKTCLLECVDELGFLMKQEAAIAAYDRRRVFSLDTLA